MIYELYNMISYTMNNSNVIYHSEIMPSCRFSPGSLDVLVRMFRQAAGTRAQWSGAALMGVGLIFTLGENVSSERKKERGGFKKTGMKSNDPSFLGGYHEVVLFWGGCHDGGFKKKTGMKLDANLSYTHVWVVGR